MEPQQHSPQQQFPEYQPPPERSSRGLLPALLGCAGLLLFAGVGVILFAFFILPNVVSTDAVKQAVEEELNRALAESKPQQQSIAGAPLSVINPFVSELETRDLSYRWEPGQRYAYEINVKAEQEGQRPFEVQAICSMKVGQPRTIEKSQAVYGTAFAIAPNYLATNSQLVQLAMRISVYLAGVRHPARVVDIDPDNNLAILEIEGTAEPLSLDSTHPVQLEEKLFCVGYPSTEETGQDIAITPGAVSAISDGPKFELAAGLHSGNQGSPVLNAAGRVVGIAGLIPPQNLTQGAYSICRVEALQALAERNSIELTSHVEPSPIESSTSDANDPNAADTEDRASAENPLDVALDNPSASIGLVEITGQADTTYHNIDVGLKYSGSISMPNVIINGVQQDMVREQIFVSQLGNLRYAQKSTILPYVYEWFPEFIVQRFDSIAEDNWFTVKYVTLQGAPRNSTPGFPFRFGTARANAPEKPLLQGVMRFDWKLLDTTDSVISFKRKRQLQSLDDPTQPSVTADGEGVWKFDIKSKVPLGLTEEFTFKKRIDGVVKSTQVRIEVASIDVASIEERERIAREKAAERNRLAQLETTVPNPELVTQLLTEIQQAAGDQRTTLTRLAKIAIVESQRERVLRQMRIEIQRKNSPLTSLAWAVYMHWADESCAPELRRIVAGGTKARVFALKALGGLHLEEDIPLVISNLDDFQNDPARLVGYGEQFELALCKAFQEADGHRRKFVFTPIMRDVGTEFTVGKLKEMRAAADRDLVVDIEQIVWQIESNLKSPARKGT